ncbi:MAG: apolipoprotein A1/A4/E family protein, partial [Prevotella sp.]|nr:apolipoprotein A1/A4/E family protein [Prevotella sp.]
MKTVLHEMQVGKRLIGLLSMLAFAVLSWGENIQVSMDDFSILPGETHQVAINVTSDVECGSAFEGIIDLPAGLTIVPDADEGEYVIKNTERCSRKFSLLSASSLENATLQPNQVKFSMYSSNGDNLAGTSGAVLYFTVRASEELAEDSQIRLIESKIKGNNPSSSEPALSVSCAANVHNATFVAAVMNLTAPSFTLTPTKEYDLTFSFEKNKDVISFQADITLPAGMSFVADASGDYVVFNEARLTSSHVFDTNLLNGDKTLRIMLYHPKNTPIKLDEGEFFTVKVKADAALAASAVVSVSKMEFVQNASQLYHPADFTVAVSNPDVAAKAEADAALLQLNTSFEEVKKTIAGYAESVQTKFQAEVETINLSIASLVETLAQDVANGDVFANASTRNAAIEKVSVQISQLSVDAAAAAANEAQYKADVAAIAEVQAQFDAAKKTVTGYAESVQASFAETIAALETSVADLTKTAKA